MSHSPLPWFLIISSLLATEPAFSQQPSLKEIQTKLRAIEMKGEDCPENEVPKEAQDLLPVLRRGIRDVIVGDLETEGAVTAAEHLRVELLTRLEEKGASVQKEGLSPYGDLRGLEVRVFNFNPALLAVQTDIGVSCGLDSSLYIFQRQGRSWRPAIFLESGPYTQVNGAKENLDYRISEEGVPGKWYVVVAFSRPWCTSCWSGLQYELLHPAPEPEKPSIAYQSRVGFYRCAEPAPYKLVASRDEFSVIYPDIMSRDFDLFARISFDRFRIDQNGLSRVPPKSQPAVHFIDQWLDLPEAEAIKLVKDSAKSQAVDWHRKLEKEQSKEELQSYESKYDFVQKCQRGATWQVGLSLIPKRGVPKESLPSHLFFEVSAEKNGTVLARIGTAPLSACKGTKEKPEGANIGDLQYPN